MTVVEKIIQLCDRRLSLLSFGKIHRPEIKAELDAIAAKLDQIKSTCPASWARAGEKLNP